jgi:chaperonin GroES
VLIKPASLEEMEGATTSFGIIIPDTAKEKPEQGTIVAVGTGKRTDDGKIVPLNVKVGDKVMFSKYGFDEVKVGGEQYYIVSEQNILAVIKN